MMNYTNKQFGALGEKLAVKYLKERKCKILEKNYKNKVGEIDIIALDRSEIAFIEVKTRSAQPYLSGRYSVDKRKQFHIMRAASWYMELKKTALQPRFDIIAIEIDRSSGELIRIEHFKNAFSQTESYSRF